MSAPIHRSPWLLAIGLGLQFPRPALAQTFLTDMPVPNGIVYSVKYDILHQVVYIGGAFTHVNGQPRNHLASIDVLNGTLTSWNPNINGPVYAMQLDWDTLYVGGAFSMAGTTPRNNLASFALVSGALGPWNPDANGAVRTLDIGGTTAYVGGAFTTIGGTPVPHVGGVSLEGTGPLTSCIPSSCDADVRSLRVHGSVFWVGGDFGLMGSSAREHLAALNYIRCGTTSWNPGADGTVYAVSEGSGTEVHVAGAFQNVGGQYRPGVAAVDQSTGNATAWNANCDGEGRCLAANPWVLFVGGQFDHLSGEPRNGLGAVRLSDGGDVGWDPELANGVNPVVVHGLSTRGAFVDYVFAGGDFQTVGGTQHPYFAAWSGYFTGVPEDAGRVALNVYPNPFDDVINLDGDLMNVRTVLIHNILGERILTCAVARSINLASLTAGCYVLTVVNGEGLALARSWIVRR